MYLVGRMLVIAATHQLQHISAVSPILFLGYGQRFHRERVSLLNVRAIITGGYKHEGSHDVAAHDDFIHYILHTLLYSGQLIMNLVPCLREAELADVRAEQHTFPRIDEQHHPVGSE